MCEDMEETCKPIPQENVSEVIERLRKGNERYLDGKLECVIRQREVKSTNQEPYVAIVSCADSRVIPERIFDAGPGHLFVARVAGNIANTATVASIEFAVQQLGTRAIVVLGHQGCGAVKAAVDIIGKPAICGPRPHTNPILSDSLDALVARIELAVVEKGRVDWKDLEERNKKKYNRELTKVIKMNARLNALELVRKSEIIRRTKGVEVYYAYHRLNCKDDNPGACRVKFRKVWAN